jgi:hypothetical protein
MRLSDEKKIVPILASIDINAGTDCDSVDMAEASHVAFVFVFASDLSGDAVLTVNSGATHGTKTTAMTFTYRYGSAAIAAATADVLTDEATSAALTLTGTTFVSRMLIVEVDAAELTDGHRYITPSFSAAADAGSVSCVAIVTPRYASMAADTLID